MTVINTLHQTATRSLHRRAETCKPGQGERNQKRQSLVPAERPRKDNPWAVLTFQERQSLNEHPLPLPLALRQDQILDIHHQLIE